MIESIFENSAVQIIGASSAGRNDILRMAQSSDLRRARHLLHKDHRDQPQSMLIFLERESVVGMHRHPKEKTEIYIVLEGQLLVKYITDSGQQNECLFAPWGNDEQLSSVSIHRDGIWHEPSAVSEFTIYLEIYSGPFDKEVDVEYK